MPSVSRRPATTAVTAQPATGPAGAGPARERPQPRALTEGERGAILDELHSERFVDMSPTEVWATLLDEGRYLGSISTFYRLLRQAGESRERRSQATHPATVKPELVADRRMPCGRGTSPSCADRRSGATTTCT